MTAPQRIQLRRTKGWRKPEGAIVVSRPSRWGNPFGMVRDDSGERDGWWVQGDLGTPVRLGAPRFHDTKHAAAADAVRRYRRWIFHQQRIDSLVPLLRGHDLACWCPLDQPCHADVLLDLANEVKP